MTSPEQISTASPVDLAGFGAAPIRAGQELDWAALDSYLRSVRPDLPAGPPQIGQFLGGFANLTYLFVYEDGPKLVVRRPPFGALAPGAHDMGREFRVLRALAPHYPPAPAAIALCEDVSVIGAPFLVTDFRPGVVVRGAIPAELAVGSDIGKRLGYAAVDAFADLHDIEVTGEALTGLGRPAGFLDRQVAGWAKRWQAVSGGGDSLMDRVGVRLHTAIPAPQRVSVVHNDPKLDNCQFTPGDPDHVTSVFDWDMATLGDPLADLGTLLNYWPDPSDTEENHANAPDGTPELGLPARAEVINRYALRTGLDVANASWYEAFASWKVGVLRQQMFARFQRGESSDPRHGEVGAKVEPAARHAARILDTRTDF
jgi:aminoglycoside phosphotransferase (APT) family kinase protein